MIHVLDTRPKSYNGIVTWLEAEIGKDVLDLGNMRESTQTQFKKIEKRRKDSEPSNKVTWTIDFNQRFKGTCFKCGKQDHKGVE